MMRHGWHVWLICMTMLLVPHLVCATEVQAENPYARQGGMGYFMFGDSRTDLGDLNSALRGAGFTTFAEHQMSVGGGAHGINRRLITGFEGMGFMEKTGTGLVDLGGGNTLQLNTALEGGYGFFNVGYLAYATKNTLVYPLIGVGGGAITFRVAERGPMPGSFAGVITAPPRQAELTTTGLLAQVAVGIDQLLASGGTEKGYGGLMVGARLGYIFAPGSGDWRLTNVPDDLTVPGGPEAAITGPYFRLLIGGGGFSREKK